MDGGWSLPFGPKVEALLGQCIWGMESGSLGSYFGSLSIILKWYLHVESWWKVRDFTQDCSPNINTLLWPIDEISCGVGFYDSMMSGEIDMNVENEEDVDVKVEHVDCSYAFNTSQVFV